MAFRTAGVQIHNRYGTMASVRQTAMVQTATDTRYYWEIEQGTDKWHALRLGVITASTIGVLTTSTGKPANNDTSRTAIYKLLAERITGESEASFYNDDMMRGHMLEPGARDLYAKHTGHEVRECGFVTRRTNGILLGYSPDGLIGDDGIIEIKAPRPKKHLAAMLDDQIPPEYIPQVQTGLAVTGRQWCDFISYAPGLPLFIKRVERDEITIAQLILAAQAAEEILAGLMVRYHEAAEQFPATEPIQPEQEIVI
jgi:putative phage-type endonuclease